MPKEEGGGKLRYNGAPATDSVTWYGRKYAAISAKDMQTKIARPLHVS